ncbi:homeobox-domain-containing protein [Coniophora puteana RWD-64-598 SS2]|uniref:Homeobox-domain-containing protein n=1 Tax=Coniophora puteana (strain RWD-64-598) TaxID=741705 RepID=A0A5M3N7Z1_CONPW|nr:homeobox-domain-containing protein [Coniophora puteana RWD-64-598 SS2]EIW87277.1 homeobox-domain-containing protein [Coniophora puteana RWD-64-598 SS2]
MSLQSLARTSSETSVCSTSTTASGSASMLNIVAEDAARRTRKRFSSLQLTMLEQLFHATSHPTREERETLARSAGMEMKSVTIWFQNKRQMERKLALHHATNGPNVFSEAGNHIPLSAPGTTSIIPLPSVSQGRALSTPHPTFSRPSRTLSNVSLSSHVPHAHPRQRTLSAPRSSRPLTTRTPSRRPTLDGIASLSESRYNSTEYDEPPDSSCPATPQTPSKRREGAALWESMPSSPLGPTNSPPSREREYIDFVGSRARSRTGGRTTLEWACAAARVAGRKKAAASSSSSKSKARASVGAGAGQGTDDDPFHAPRAGADVVMGGDETEDEEMEAITPSGSLTSEDYGWPRDAGAGRRLIPRTRSLPESALLKALPVEVKKPDPAPMQVQDDVMDAALILCGLGRRG